MNSYELLPPLLQLPADIYLYLCLFLSSRDVAILQRVSKRIKKLTNKRVEEIAQEFPTNKEIVRYCTICEAYGNKDFTPTYKLREVLMYSEAFWLYTSDPFESSDDLYPMYYLCLDADLESVTDDDLVSFRVERMQFDEERIVETIVGDGKGFIGVLLLVKEWIATNEVRLLPSVEFLEGVFRQRIPYAINNQYIIRMSLHCFRILTHT